MHKGARRDHSSPDVVIANYSNVVIASIFSCVLAYSLSPKLIVGNLVFLDISHWAAFPGFCDERAVTRSMHTGFETGSTRKHFCLKLAD